MIEVKGLRVLGFGDSGGFGSEYGNPPCLGFRAIGPKLPLRVLMWNSTGTHGGLGSRRFRRFPLGGGGAIPSH